MERTLQRVIVADLHVHTTRSDGSCSPAEVLDRARSHGLSALAICDHDTFAGYLDACEYARSCAGSGCADLPRIISGIEVSAQVDGVEVHILGYFADPCDHELAAMLELGDARRRERAARIVALLAADGYPVSFVAMISRGLKPNRPNIARMLVESGSAPSVSWCFDHLIGDGLPYYVPRIEVEASEAIAKIRAAGGVAIFAHPVVSHAEHLIEGLVAHGLEGIEVYHSQQSPEDSARLLETAERFGLAVTGGSDWHGDGVRSGTLGGCGLTECELKAFLALNQGVHTGDR